MRLLVCLMLLAASCQSQQLAAGALLVATAKSHDPDFAGSVVLLIRYDSESAIGLMLNKPTTVPISEVLPEAKVKSITVYAGGPIALGLRGLVRSNSPPFFSVISNKPQLLKLISSGAPPSSFRIYAGYTGWTARQLQSEVARGLWKVLPAVPDRLFQDTPGGRVPR
jgi:putative transcriptional regulator